MNMFRAFLELDKLNESYDDYGDRQELIDKLKGLGRRYHFDKYSNKQLYCIWKEESAKEAAKSAEEAAFKDYYDSKIEKPTCADCGKVLTDGGYCPVCDDGAEDLDEDIFTDTPFGSTWVTSSGAPVKLSIATSSGGTSPVAQTSTPSMSTKPIVTIVYDSVARKLRARADDGIHGEANVAFPNALRIRSGLQYEVDKLIWNGKNYRVSGNINQL